MAFLQHSGSAPVPAPNWLMHPTLTHFPIRGISAAYTNLSHSGRTPHYCCLQLNNRAKSRGAKKHSTS
jgi:hypothetical protein